MPSLMWHEGRNQPTVGPARVVLAKMAVHVAGFDAAVGALMPQSCNPEIFLLFQVGLLVLWEVDFMKYHLL